MKMPFLEDWAVTSPGTLWGVPEGADAMALLHLARSHGGRAVHIAVDDAGLARMAASLGILGVGREHILEFPAWDCLPYDRISPGGVLTGKRLHCLAELATHADRPRIVLTTFNAWLQSTPPRELFAASTLSLKPGDQISAANLTRFFTANAYHRADTVREAGNMLCAAILSMSSRPAPMNRSGSISSILKLRQSVMDPETQRSTGKASALSLNPVSEFILDETISAFEAAIWNSLARQLQDPLYVSVSEGRHHPGMEHMLPLFHARLDHLSDFTSDAPVLMAEVDAAAVTVLARSPISMPPVSKRWKTLLIRIAAVSGVPCRRMLYLTTQVGQAATAG